MTQSIDSIKKFVGFISPYIEADLRRFIADNDDRDAIVIDWLFLPMLSIFDDWDLSVYVNCDLETKVKRLSGRLQADGRLDEWPEGPLLERIKNSELDKFGYSAKYTIENNTTLEDLGDKLNLILTKEKIIGE